MLSKSSTAQIIDNILHVSLEPASIRVEKALTIAEELVAALSTSDAATNQLPCTNKGGEANGTASTTSRPLALTHPSFDEVIQRRQRMLYLLEKSVNSCSFPDDVKSVISGCFEVIIDLFLCYNFDCDLFSDKQITKSFEDTFVHVHKALSCGVTWMKYFKYKTASFFSAWMDQPQPDNKGVSYGNSKYILGGVFYDYTRKIMASEAKYSFLNSVLMLKKGMPRADDQMVKAAENETFIKLTTIPKNNNNRSVEINTVIPLSYDLGTKVRPYTVNLETCIAQVRRTVREIFTGHCIGLNDLTRPYAPSSSSNYNNTRGRSGTYGHSVMMSNKNKSFDFQSDWFKVDNVHVSGYESEYYDNDRRTADLESNSNYSKYVPGLGVKLDQFRCQFKQFYWKNVKAALEEEPIAVPLGLKEALKVRVITKGPPLTYFVMKPFQRFMWSVLKEHPSFRYIGTPITPELFLEDFPEESMGMSGDYESATDNLNPALTNAAIDALFELMEEEVGYSFEVFRLLCRKSMTGHVIQNPHDDTEFLPQLWAQLMGSISSFPFLNILNASCVRYAYEVAHGISISLRALPSTFNGDDVYCQYKSETFPDCWRTIGSFFGLSESLGKTYFSRTFAVMNSMMLMREESRWSQVPYIHMGLLRGLRRSSAGDPVHDVLELGTIQDELIQFAPPESVPLMKEFFLYMHGTKLKASNLAWFIPRHLGGLGLKGVADACDRAQANRLAKVLAEGYQIPPLRIAMNWHTYQVQFEEIKRFSGNVVTYHFYREMSYEVDEDINTFFLYKAWRENIYIIHQQMKDNPDEVKRSLRRLYEKSLKSRIDPITGKTVPPTIKEAPLEILVFRKIERVLPLFESFERQFDPGTGIRPSSAKVTTSGKSLSPPMLGYTLFERTPKCYKDPSQYPHLNVSEKTFVESMECKEWVDSFKKKNIDKKGLSRPSYKNIMKMSFSPLTPQDMNQEEPVIYPVREITSDDLPIEAIQDDALYHASVAVDKRQ